MGLFSKKEGVPSLPTSPSLPPLPSLKEEPIKRNLPELPSFPSDSKNENLNQEMVKSAVTEIPSPENLNEKAANTMIPPKPIVNTEVISPKSEEPEISEPQKPISMSQSSIPELPKTKKPITEEPKSPAKIPSLPKKEDSSDEPIFVRIDKFQAAQKNFNDIKSKMAEIEGVLKKIKEVKVQEEEELKGWTESAEKLKVKLSEIDGDIFNKL